MGEEYANYVEFGSTSNGDNRTKSKSKSGSQIALNLSIPRHRGHGDRGSKLSSIPDTIGMIGDGKISPNTVNAVVRDTQQHFPQTQYRGYTDYVRGNTVSNNNDVNQNHNKNQSPSPSLPQKRAASPMSIS